MKIETPEGRSCVHGKIRKTHTNELTFHGLRYNYIQFRMQQEMEKGYSLEQAAARITQEVGHERTDVIKIYWEENLIIKCLIELLKSVFLLYKIGP